MTTTTDEQFILGDLNYRMDCAQPDVVLEHILNAGVAETKLALISKRNIPSSSPMNMKSMGDDKSLVVPSGSTPSLEKGGEVRWVGEKYEAFYYIGDGSWQECLSPLSVVYENDRPWEDDEPSYGNDDERKEEEGIGGGLPAGAGGIGAAGGKSTSGNYKKSIATGNSRSDVDHIIINMGDRSPGRPAKFGHNYSVDSGNSMSYLQTSIYDENDCDTSQGQSSTGSYFVKEEAMNSDQPQPWMWVRSMDQLTKEMNRGEVFAGFSEGPISFPPSYRWHRGAVAGDFNKVSTNRINGFEKIDSVGTHMR